MVVDSKAVKKFFDSFDVSAANPFLFISTVMQIEFKPKSIFNSSKTLMKQTKIS